MLELPVAAFGGDKEPTIFLQFVEYVDDFHDISVAQSLQETKPALRRV
jgi:hypothetical protein